MGHTTGSTRNRRTRAPVTVSTMVTPSSFGSERLVYFSTILDLSRSMRLESDPRLRGAAASLTIPSVGQTVILTIPVPAFPPLTFACLPANAT